MPLSKITAVAVASVFSAAIAFAVMAQDIVVDPAIAAMTPEQLVDARQATMQSNRAVVGEAETLKGAAAVAAADTLIQNFTNLPALFAPDSIVGDSRALPLIWEEKDAFDAILAEAKAKAMEAKTAAEAGDDAGFAAAVGGIGPLCGQCHGKYRA
jgi:cytochrome c556